MTRGAEVTETANDKSVRHVRLPVKLWRRFVTYWEGSFQRGPTIVGAIFVLAGFLLVLVQLSHLNEAARRSDSYAQAQALYQANLTTYNAAEANYLLCLDSVSRSDVNRSQWSQLADIIEKIGPNAAVYAQEIRTGPLLATAPRLASDCPLPGVAPVAPSR